MPIYEYRCEQGHTFEVMQRMTDDPVLSCRTCEAPVQRVFHPIAVHFKGSGFYNTDYGTRKRAREKESASSDGAGGGSKSSEGGGSSEGGSSSGGSSSGGSSSGGSSGGEKAAASAAGG